MIFFIFHLKNLFKILMEFIIRCDFAYGNFMNQQEFCQDCHHKHDCRQIYRQLGHTSCPPVVHKVIVAFLLPLIVFIVSLAVFDKIFITAGSNNLFSAQNGSPSNVQELKTAIGFFLALIITVVCVIITKLLTKRLHKDF